MLGRIVVSISWEHRGTSEKASSWRDTSHGCTLGTNLNYSFDVSLGLS